MVSSNFPNRPFRLEENVWLLSQNVAANTSVLRTQLWIKKNSTSPTFSGNPSSFTFNINGAQVAAGSFTYDFRNSDQLLLAQVDVTIPHNADGSKPSVAIDGFCNAQVLGYTEVHSAVGLPTIPRASTFTMSPSPHDNRPGQVTTFNISRASSGFTHYIKVQFGAWSEWIASGVGTSFQWTPPWDLLKQIPNADTGVGTVWVDTYNGGTYIGTTTSLWRLNAPASVVPTVQTLAVADQNPDVASIVGAFVQSLSRAKLTVVGAGVYDSTIVSAQAKMLGSTVASGSEIAVTSAGALAVTGTVTDSRGRTGTANGTVTALAYTPPAATAYQARRCSAAGAIQDDGAYLRVDLSAAIASLINGTQRNGLTIRAFTRPRGSGAWTARNVITPAGLSYASWFLVSGGGIYSTTGSWDVRVQIHDKFNVYVADTTVSTISVTIDMNGKNVGIGKIWEQGALDVGGDTYTSGDFRHRGGYPVEPVGIVASFAGATAPSGWLLCDGSAVSRTTYAALFTAIGIAYGAGNGSSTFNLPDLRGRIPVGRDTAQTEFDVLGETGGAKTHTLTAEQLPAHQHRLGPNFGGNLGFGESSATNAYTVGFGNVRTSSNDLNSGTQSGTVGQAHNNLQPYLVLNHIIKAL